MSRYNSWLNTATTIVKLYKGDQPLAGYLKTFFASNKKYGSNDRRQISQLCYCYYRLGKLTHDTTIAVEELILAGLLLCTTGKDKLLEELRPQWLSFADNGIEDKLRMLNQWFEEQQSSFSEAAVFPWEDRLSNPIDYPSFCHSFFIQPEVFIRIRPGHASQVRQKLQKAGIYFNETDKTDCLSFTNATKIEEALVLNKEAVIQDYNSQNVFSVVPEIEPRKINAWDCCAASGGKSILATDTLGKLDLTVSDIRPSILSNLRKRLATAGISLLQSLQLDLTMLPALSALTCSPFDLVICDVPCSGSGTWSRTPEQLTFFSEEQIDQFHSLQKTIAVNAASQLNTGGYFLYITCSVFKMENERVVEHLTKNTSLQLIEMKVLEGYTKKADTMFAALLKK